MADEDVKAELERLRKENVALKKGASSNIRMKVSEKGALSVYGMGRFPVTLYKERWLRLLDMADDIRTAGWVMAPPVIAVLLAPVLLMLVGQSFTFFHAMALVLLLSIANDYAVFSAESPAARRSVTLLAVWMAAMTTLLSFGLLAVSGVPAVHNFGSTMLIGILLAFFAAPLASRGRRKANAPPVHDGVAKDVCGRVV
jgi:hypothetical protein